MSSPGNPNIANPPGSPASPPVGPPAGPSHRGRNVAVGIIIGIVLVIFLIVAVRACVEKRRENARDLMRTATVTRITTAGAPTTSGGAAVSSGAQQNSAGSVSNNQSDSSGEISGEAAPGSGEAAPGSGDGASPESPANPDEQPSEGPISYTPLSIVSQSVLPNPVPLGGLMDCAAQVRGNAVSVTMHITGPPGENYLFDMVSNGAGGDTTTWTYSHYSPQIQGAYLYSVTATAADGTSVSADGGSFIVAAQ